MGAVFDGGARFSMVCFDDWECPSSVDCCLVLTSGVFGVGVLDVALLSVSGVQLGDSVMACGAFVMVWRLSVNVEGCRFFLIPVAWSFGWCWCWYILLVIHYCLRCPWWSFVLPSVSFKLFLSSWC
ncbi:unnamed protein product [Amaranthus hypochondriacus]